jgi:hypothetical protein
MATLADQAKKAGYADLGEAMGDKVNKLNRGTDAAAVMQAGQMHVLSVTPGDPGPTWEVTANELAASVQIPFTILFGQQTGRLASDEDKTDWAIRRNTRRNGFLTTASPRCWSASGRLGLSTRRPKARSPSHGATCWRLARREDRERFETGRHCAENHWLLWRRAADYSQ